MSHLDRTSQKPRGIQRADKILLSVCAENQDWSALMDGGARVDGPTVSLYPIGRKLLLGVPERLADCTKQAKTPLYPAGVSCYGVRVLCAGNQAYGHGQHWRRC